MPENTGNKIRATFELNRNYSESDRSRIETEIRNKLKDSDMIKGVSEVHFATERETSNR